LRVKQALTAVALQKRLAPFYRKQGNEKQAQVMIHPPQAGRGQSANRASAGIVIHLDLTRLYAADEDEGAPPAYSFNPSMVA
jgi:hypothetical protein